MSLRIAVRIVLIVVLLGLAWKRMAVGSPVWLIAAIIVVLLVLLAMVMQRKPRDTRDEVPKRPLGL
jgi:uncharacterized membrane protein